MFKAPGQAYSLRRASAQVLDLHPSRVLIIVPQDFHRALSIALIFPGLWVKA